MQILNTEFGIELVNFGATCYRVVKKLGNKIPHKKKVISVGEAELFITNGRREITYLECAEHLKEAGEKYKISQSMKNEIEICIKELKESGAGSLKMYAKYTNPNKLSPLEMSASMDFTVGFLSGEKTCKIKQCRKSVGLTQKQVSELLEIPLITLEQWEAKKRNPPAYVEKLIIEKLESMAK